MLSMSLHSHGSHCISAPFFGKKLIKKNQKTGKYVLFLNFYLFSINIRVQIQYRKIKYYSAKSSEIRHDCYDIDNIDSFHNKHKTL